MHITLPIPRRMSSISLSKSNNRRSRRDKHAQSFPAPIPEAQLRNDGQFATTDSSGVVEDAGLLKLNNFDHRQEENTARISNKKKIYKENLGVIPVAYLPEHGLDRRPSSPLLGQLDERNHAALFSAFDAIPETLCSTEVSSTHQIYESPCLQPTQSHKTAISSRSDLSLRNFPPAVTQQGLDPVTEHDWPIVDHKEHRNSFRRKNRPPMIDLSKLFPRPRDVNVPLLSPHRLTASPSPVSIISDASGKPRMHERIFTSNKLTKAPRAKDAADMRFRKQKELSQHEEESHRHQLESYRLSRDHHQAPKAKCGLGPTLSQRRKYDGWRDPTKYRNRVGPDWFDGPAGDVSDNEEDLSLPESNVHDTVPAMVAVLQGPGNIGYAGQKSKALSSHKSSSSKSSGGTAGASLNGSAAKHIPSAKDLRSSLYHSSSRSEKNSPEWPLNRNSGSFVSEARSYVRTAKKKASKMSLNTVNLNEASILCLSSSEDDEGDEEGIEDAICPANRAVIRDSIASIDGCTEICMAQAIETRGNLSVKQVPARQPSQNRIRTPMPATQDKGGPSNFRSNNPSRNGSIGRPGKPPSSWEPPSSPLPPLSRKSVESQRSSSQPPSLQQTPPTSQRRSRYMAVTRQEEYLLELIRRNKGSIPTSILVDRDLNSHEPDRRVQKSPRPISTDTSSPKSSPASKNIRYNKDTGTFFDAGSVASPGLGENFAIDSGLVASNTSPSTSLSSPLTPKMPSLRRVSPKPRYSPFTSAIIEDTGSHSGSGSALMFDDEENGGNDGEKSEDLPIWALGWGNGEPAGVAVAH